MACFVSFITKTALSKIKIGSGVEYIKDVLFLEMTQAGQPAKIPLPDFNEPIAVSFNNVEHKDLKKIINDWFKVGEDDTSVRNQNMLWEMVLNRRNKLYLAVVAAVAKRNEELKTHGKQAVETIIAQQGITQIDKTPSKKISFGKVVEEVHHYFAQLKTTVDEIAELQLTSLSLHLPNVDALPATAAGAELQEAGQSVTLPVGNANTAQTLNTSSVDDVVDGDYVEWKGFKYEKTVGVDDFSTSVEQSDKSIHAWKKAMQEKNSFLKYLNEANVELHKCKSAVGQSQEDVVVIVGQDFGNEDTMTIDVIKDNAVGARDEYLALLIERGKLYTQFKNVVAEIKKVPNISGESTLVQDAAAGGGGSAAAVTGGTDNPAGSGGISPLMVAHASTAATGGGGLAAPNREPAVQSPAVVVDTQIVQTPQIPAGSGGNSPPSPGVVNEMRKLNVQIEAQKKELTELRQENGRLKHTELQYQQLTENHALMTKEKDEWKQAAEKMWYAIDGSYKNGLTLTNKNAGQPATQTGNGVVVIQKMKKDMDDLKHLNFEAKRLQDENNDLKASLATIDAVLTTGRLANGAKREDVVTRLVTLEDTQSAFMTANEFNGLDDIKTKKVTWTQKISDLQNLCEQARIEIADLKMDRDAGVDKIKALQVYHSCIDFVMDRNHLNRHVNKEEDFKNLCDEHFTQFRKLESDMSGLVDENSALKVRIHKIIEDAKASAHANPTALKSQLDVATGELAVLQTAIGGLNTKLAQVRQDLVLETAKLGAVTKQYNHSQQQADIFENALNECRKELAEEQKQHKLLKTTKAPTGGTGPKADHADTSATAKLDDAVSQLLLQL